LDTSTTRQSSLAFVAVAIGALAAVRLLAAALVPISPDEAYYFDWSLYPSWGYYDHPPMVAWWIWASTSLFGSSVFGIRLLTVLSVIPASLFTYITGRALFDRPTGALAALWLNATLLVGVGGFLTTPDAPSSLSWTLAVMAFALLVRSGNGAWWPLVGLAVGLGIQSKLTNLFLPLGLLLALCAERDLRRWLTNLWTWAGVLVALLTIAPLVAWNASHGWATLSQFARLDAGHFTPLKLPEFIATQFGLLNPLVAIFAGLAVVAWLAGRAAYPRSGIAALTWIALPLLIYMAFHALHQQVQGNWLAPIYPTVALVAAAAAASAPERWAPIRSLAFPLGAILTVIGLVLTADPGDILPSPLDAGRQLRGWDDVASEAAALRKQTGAAWIAVDGYYAAAELGWHLRADGAPVFPLGDPARYVYRPRAGAAIAARPGLVLANADIVNRCFANATSLGEITRTSRGAVLDTFPAYAVKTGPASADPACALVR